MKMKKSMIAAVLVIAIAAPIAGFVGGDGPSGTGHISEILRVDRWPAAGRRARQIGQTADRQVEIEFLGPGVEAFCLTCGWK